MIAELLTWLDSLPNEPFFYLEDGPLKNRLLESYLEEDATESETAEFEHNTSLRIRHGDRAATPRLECRLEAADFHFQLSLTPEQLSDAEVTELLDLLRLNFPAPCPRPPGPGKKILRKKRASGLLNIAAAAKALGLSQRALKSLIPCSETRISGEQNNRRIEEYYWDQHLIDRLLVLADKHQQSLGYSSDDLAFIAATCCDGDQRWARDCIAGFLHQRLLSGA